MYVSVRSGNLYCILDIFVLPSHTTHILQLCDIEPYSYYKSWSRANHQHFLLAKLGTTAYS